MTGESAPGRKYAAATLAHGESVPRGFYEFHREAGTGPLVNPLPLARERITTRWSRTVMRRPGFRPAVALRAPRRIPYEKFDELFALLPSHRNRALIAFWVSTSARASELLGATAGDADAGKQLITVIRKGSRRMHQLP